MLQTIGIKETNALFADIDPAIRLPSLQEMPDALSEQELMEHIGRLAGRNRLPELSFLGGGAYHHFIPATVDAILQRGEFFTSYTPYQPEVSQGNLQAIWEYQSMIASLTGMDVANASLYDGATAAAEAMLMCVNTKKRRGFLVSRAVDPHIREVLATYAAAHDVAIKEISLENGKTSPAHLEAELNGECAGIIIQSPNFFGIIEDYTGAAKLAHAKDALVVACFTEALALGMLRPPGDLDADIVAGEGQSFGISLSFGGPGLGIIACKETFLRKLPGRIVGRTVDREGKQGFVLTLQAREQHIRREGATSNICSNHALCALAASVYLATLGKEGVRGVAELNYHRAHYAKKNILAISGKRGKKTVGSKFSAVFTEPFFNEFVVKTRHAEKLIGELAHENIAAGIPLEQYYPELKDCFLVTVTEMNRKTDIDRFVKILK
jgi:glycine dehydrogenase subunit 1